MSIPHRLSGIPVVTRELRPGGGLAICLWTGQGKQASQIVRTFADAKEMRLWVRDHNDTHLFQDWYLFTSVDSEHSIGPLYDPDVEVKEIAATLRKWLKEQMFAGNIPKMPFSVRTGGNWSYTSLDVHFRFCPDHATRRVKEVVGDWIARRNYDMRQGGGDRIFGDVGFYESVIFDDPLFWSKR